MFKRLQPTGKPIEIHFEQRVISARENETVAAALLAADILSFRQVTQGGATRGPYCMIENCFECLVEIDGKPNLQACQYRVRDGMRIRMQRGLRGPGCDDES